MNCSTAASATNMCLRSKKRGIFHNARTNFTSPTAKNNKSCRRAGKGYRE